MPVARKSCLLFACALLGTGLLMPAQSLAAEGRPSGGMRQPIGPGGFPPSGGPSGGPPINGPSRPGAIRSGPDPSGIFSPPGGGPEDSRERRGASISYRGTRYLVSDGQWFEQRGSRLIAVEAPAGVMVRDLPDGYSMRWIDGVPYFYADGLYYIWREGVRRYEILQYPPAALAQPAPEHPEARPNPPPAGK
jgi:hypothetical protein